MKYLPMLCVEVAMEKQEFPTEASFNLTFQKQSPGVVL